jgi:hypothetical protein
MDRNTFLSSLPFLYPSVCVSWPPRTELSQDRTSAAGRRETLLRDQFVSIEPVVDSRNLGPAFFSNEQAHHDLDPAMCKFEMAIYSSKPDTVASTSTFESPVTPAIKSRTEQANETVVFFRVDDRVYQVDLGQIQSLNVLHNEEREDAAPKPSCLLVRFSTCHFRIFSTSSGMVTAEYDKISTLNSTMARLTSCLSASNTPFPCGDSSLASPTGSSARSSSTELGQREMSRDADMMTHHHHEETPPAAKEETKEEAILKTIQRHQRAHAQSQQGLESLQHLLHLPQPPAGEEPPSNLRDHASALLTAVADDWNSSYCSRAQLVQAAQAYDSRIESYQTQLDDVLTNFFPSSRPTKRSRTTNGSGRSIVPGDKPKPTSDQVVACASDLIQQHKEAVQGRHALSLLPNRG